MVKPVKTKNDWRTRDDALHIDPVSRTRCEGSVCQGQRLMQDFEIPMRRSSRFVRLFMCRKIPLSLSLRTSRGRRFHLPAAGNICPWPNTSPYSTVKTFLAWVGPVGKRSPSPWCLTPLPNFTSPEAPSR